MYTAVSCVFLFVLYNQNNNAFVFFGVLLRPLKSPEGPGPGPGPGLCETGWLGPSSRVTLKKEIGLLSACTIIIGHLDLQPVGLVRSSRTPGGWTPPQQPAVHHCVLCNSCLCHLAASC
uniref:Uncharacterized protein n=1 Tax=Echeneis naucrates TaxID=173247 RepID=A0A665TD52_ECHNA